MSKLGKSAFSHTLEWPWNPWPVQYTGGEERMVFNETIVVCNSPLPDATNGAISGCMSLRDFGGSVESLYVTYHRVRARSFDDDYDDDKHSF